MFLHNSKLSIIIKNFSHLGFNLHKTIKILIQKNLTKRFTHKISSCQYIAGLHPKSFPGRIPFLLQPLSCWHSLLLLDNKSYNL